MLPKIIAAATSPFTIALIVVTLMIGGAGVGLLIAEKINQSDIERRRQERTAAEIAARGPPKPERVPRVIDQETPFIARYFEFDEEFTSNFKEPKRVLIVSITLMTQRGERAYKLLEDSKIPLRALTLATLSEFPLKQAIEPDGRLLLSKALKQALNSEIRAGTGFSPIDAVLITRFFVQ
jgi:flagellar basal body-associated protein FliL